MVVLLIYSFIAGFITIFAPCIWPLLPIILSSSATGKKSKPLGITLGIVFSFAFFTLSISYLVKLFSFDSNDLRLLAVVVIGFFGLTMIVPSLSQTVEGLISKIGTKYKFSGKKFGDGFFGGLLTGLSLGIVWSPCAGPILATVASAAATLSVNAGVVTVITFYVVGAGIPLFIFSFFGNHIFSKSKFINKHTLSIQRIFGIIMILTAILIFTGNDKSIEADLLNFFPSYSNLLTKIESNRTVLDELHYLKNGRLPDLGPAPELVGISHWLNTDNRPLTMKTLKGKVVLVDFWTYTCINCIRTLPHLTAWYKKYHDMGFVIVGVHTPEFAFEKNTANVRHAIKRFGITYPVAQDNGYMTWNAYNNEYWPAEYLIDAKGNIRHTNFGEGDYGTTEKYIQELLAETGKNTNMPLSNIKDETPKGAITPETYVGLNRMDRNANGQVAGGVQNFSSPGGLPPDSFAFKGRWNIRGQYAETVKNSELTFNFRAKHVYLVIHPGKIGDKVAVYLDNRLIKEIILDSDRLYDIVDLPGKENHILNLKFENSGIECFAFTFG